jgi:hypothetical protein
MSERLPVPETLERAFESAKNLPSDWDLAQGKAAGWASLEKKLSRTDRWRRWKPVAGVLAGAAVVLAVVLTGQTLHLWNGTATDQPSASSAAKPAGKGDAKQDVKPKANNIMDMYRMRSDAYRKQGMQLFFTDPSTQGDLVRQGTQLLMIKEAQRDVLLDIDGATMMQPYYTNGTNMLFQVQGNKIGQQYYLIDLNTKKAKPVTVRSDNRTNVVLWHLENPQVVYSRLDMNAQTQSLFVYDPESGTEQKIYDTPANKSIERLIANGDQLLIGSQHELQIYDGANWKLVARSDNGAVNYIYTTVSNNNEVLYQVVEGIQQVSLSDVLNNGGVFSYNIKTGTSTRLLPEAPPGEQILVMNRTDYHPYYLISDFIADPKPEGADLKTYEMKGTLQFWQVPADRGAAKKIFEKKVKGSERVFYGSPVADIANQTEFSLIQPMPNAPWSLQYNPKQGTIKEVDQFDASHSGIAP